MRRNAPIAISAILVATILIFGVALLTPANAGTPVTNPAGVTLSIESNTNAAAAAEQTNGAGITLQLTAAFDASVDTTNAAGVTAYVGQIDPEPIAVQRNAAGVTWMLYETPRKD